MQSKNIFIKQKREGLRVVWQAKVKYNKKNRRPSKASNQIQRVMQRRSHIGRGPNTEINIMKSLSIYIERYI